MSQPPPWAVRAEAADSDVAELLSSVNAVLGLSLVLAQAASPAQAARLMTTAVPSIVAGCSAVVWHPDADGEFYERADDRIGPALERMVRPGRLHVGGATSGWAFPLTSALRAEQVFLVVLGDVELGDQQIYLLSILAQMCGTVIVNHQLTAEVRLRADADRARDVALARAAELAASESRQSAILEAALDAVVTVDAHARITYVNSAFESTFGYRASEVLGRGLAETIVPPSLRDAHHQGFARYLSTWEPRILDQRIEVTAMRAGGDEFPAELTVTRTGPPEDPSFTGYVRDVTERRRVQQELMASRARLVTASDAARQRVTRDLHDGAQQRFVTALINLQLVEQKWESAPERASELLALAIRDTRTGIADLRDTAAGIHPAILTQRGLGPALGALAARLPIPLNRDIPDLRLPAAIEASVYFFCSEALTNVVKHARATSASVRVAVSEDRCTVEVRDDGAGGARSGSDSSGLTGLRDRIGALGGSMRIISPRSRGTRLLAEIPVP